MNLTKQKHISEYQTERRERLLQSKCKSTRDPPRMPRGKKRIQAYLQVSKTNERMSGFITPQDDPIHRPLIHLIRRGKTSLVVLA